MPLGSLIHRTAAGRERHLSIDSRALRYLLLAMEGAPAVDSRAVSSVRPLSESEVSMSVWRGSCSAGAAVHAASWMILKGYGIVWICGVGLGSG